MIIWSSLKLFPYIHGYLFIFANTEIYVIYSIKLIEKLSRRHLINSSDVFVIKGFTVVRLNFRTHFLSICKLFVSAILYLLLGY